MTTGSTDRRVRYTKAALRDALVVQMQTKHISAITVTALCDLADISRSTFYLHYRDPNDLLQQVEEEVLEALRERLSATEGLDTEGPISLGAMTEILDYAHENSALARALLSENCDIGFKQDVMQFARLVDAGIAADYRQQTREYIATYCIVGAISMVEKWLRDGCPEPPDEVAHLLVKLVSGSVSGFTE